jgi:RNA polymerase sigma factor (sigma-70 family)
MDNVIMEVSVRLFLVCVPLTKEKIMARDGFFSPFSHEQTLVGYARNIPSETSHGEVSVNRSQSASVPHSIHFLDREQFYGEFQPLIRRLLRQYGDSPEMRQDLSGELYCRFCALLEGYDPTRGVPLRPYLVRQLTVFAYTYARSCWRRRRSEVYLETLSELEQCLPIDPTADWDAELTKQRVLAVLPAAIASLPLRQRQTVIWRYYDGRSFEEIAETLGVQPATARSLLRHGLNRLRQWVAQESLDVE